MLRSTLRSSSADFGAVGSSARSAASCCSYVRTAIPELYYGCFAIVARTVRTPPVGAKRSARAWRVRVDDTPIAFVDRLQGAQSQQLNCDVGDFVVRRADGLFAYQLAVVVDDAAQSITDVVRGADLLSSTPRQIHLQHFLHLPTPAYLHVPVAINAAGEKLSKQTRALALPDDALAALIAAWRFLDQPAPLQMPTDVAGFWTHALSNWSPARLPPVRMLPAPSRFIA